MTFFARSRAVCLIVFFSCTFVAGNAYANLSWEDHFSDEDPILSGSTIVADSTSVSFVTTVFSDNDSGTSDLVAFRSADFISYESGQTGAQSGNIELTFDNLNDDPEDFVELTMQFTPAVTDLAFSVLDIDGQTGRAWDDGVEIYFNGINIKTNTGFFTRGPAVFLDNESYMDGFEAGTTSVASTSTNGNVNIDLGAEEVSSIRVKYFSTDDAVANPSSQFVGLSDLSFTPVPEPTGLRLALTSLCFAAFCRKRDLQRRPMVAARDDSTTTR